MVEPHNRVVAASAPWLPSLLVNMIWRTLLTIARAKAMLRRNGQIEPTSVGRVRVRTLPTDLDLLGHMNNGRYASIFDLGRFDLLIRTGFWDLLQKQGWYAVVASETITFRKSLELWQRFTVESRLMGHDDKSVYMVHRAVVRGEVYAEMIVRARFLRRNRRHRARTTSSSRRSASPTGFRMSSPGCTTGPRHPLCRRPAPRHLASGAD